MGIADSTAKAELETYAAELEKRANEIEATLPSDGPRKDQLYYRIRAKEALGFAVTIADIAISKQFKEIAAQYERLALTLDAQHQRAGLIGPGI